MVVHRRGFPDEPVLPLTWERVRRIPAHFKEAGYRRWTNYAPRIKSDHVVNGFTRALVLEVAFCKAKLSVLRGIGPTRQAMPLGLRAVINADTR